MAKPISEVRKESRNAFIYVKALCEKKLQMFDKAEESYAFVTTLCRKKKNQKLLKSLMGLLLAKCNNSTALTLNSLDQLIGAMNDLKVEKCQKDSFLDFFVPGDGWRNDKIEKAIFYFQQRRFFKRFTKFHLRQVLGEMTIKRLKKGDIVFCETEVGVILDGKLKMLSHEASITEPVDLDTLGEGDIIGYDKADEGMSKKTESWLVVDSDFVELSFMQVEIFDFLWEFHTHNTN